MPKKLYLPTSTLNFNNIISSESISPYSFYQKRGYGFRRFEKVLPNKLDNAILLYEKYPIYEIIDSELENYPMVIEVDIETCPSKIVELGNGVYICTETIYLNPFTTSIYFNCYEDLVATKSKSERSIETKLANFYNGCYRLLNSDIAREQYNYGSIQDVEFNVKALESDIRLNKLKGFAYSYVIAANRSYNPNIVRLKMHFRKLINSLSAVLTSPHFQYGELESDDIKRLYAAIRRDIESLEGIQQEVSRIISEKTALYGVPNLAEILKQEELYDSWYIKIKNKNNLRLRNDVRPFILGGGTDKPAALDAYSDYLDSILRNLDKKSEPISIGKLPTIEHGCIDRIPDIKDFIVSLLNMYRSEMIQKDDFLSNRYQYALKGGALFREACGSNWDNSEERRYINSLLKNLNEYTEFDINSINNHTLKSFAAFFQKGDIDIEKLEDYLISNGIGDLKIAFALWGIVFGFAEMSKTYTAELFDSSDIAYKTGIYKALYKALHGIEITANLQTPIAARLRKINPTNNDDLIHINRSHKLDEIPRVTKKDSEEGGSSQDALEHKTFVDKFKDGIESIKEECKDLFGFGAPKIDIPARCPEVLVKVFSSNEFMDIKASARTWYIEKSLEIWDAHLKLSPECHKALVALKDKCEIFGTMEKWKKALALIKSDIEKGNSKGKSGSKAKLAPASKTKAITPTFKQANDKFINDIEYAWGCIIELLPNDPKVRTQVRKDLFWFLNNHQATYIDERTGNIVRGFYSEEPSDNASVIQRYHKYLENKRITQRTKDGKDMTWLCEIYNSVNIPSIISRLKDIYQ